MKQRFHQVQNELSKMNQNYQSYKAGRGYHIHLFYPRLRILNKEKREKYKLAFLKNFGGDLQKKTEKTMIALENVNHWKTGKPKLILTSKNGGVNYQVPFSNLI